MTLSFTAAIGRLQPVADQTKAYENEYRPSECVDIHDAVGRIALEDCVSPTSTPIHDTSAMDGYAIEACATNNASPDNPAVFQVVGILTPGDDPSLDLETNADGKDPCIEIMTGARFPDANSSLGRLSACVRVEDVSMILSDRAGLDQPEKLIAVTKPVQPWANRRVAGSDIKQSETLLKSGQRIMTSHILPLASVGYQTIRVAAKLRIGIWSTGKEFISEGSCSKDVNGPYLTTACREYGAGTAFLGHLDDRAQLLCREFESHAKSGDYDILITSGAVSAGKFDFVREALDNCKADIVFHGLNIRPGHPVLFARFPAKRPVAFFALPGNPGAVAACFRFLIIPYLRRLQGREAERPIIAKAAREKPETGVDKESQHIIVPSRDVDRFFTGSLQPTAWGTNAVELSGQVNSAKLQPFISANCWVHVHAGCKVAEGSVVDCYTWTAS